ncbi:peptidoglycan-binding protein [bacterium]|nr:MAG: peptidoglycan-binding protein [bacterium]
MMKKSFLSFFALVLVIGFCFNYPLKTAQAVYSISGSNSFSGTSSVAMPITDLQITGTGSEPIPVRLRVTSGTLAMSTTTGLTFTGGSSGSTVQFSGSLTNVNNALATLTYTRPGTGSDTLEVSMVQPGEVFFETNGHLYKYISGTISWNSAVTAATGQTAYGSTGYLATITSQAENDFVAARISGDGWFGASDSAVEGAWRWVTGPENGTQFWSGNGSGSVVGGQYNRWASGEPNDAGGNEDCAQFYVSSNFWNDLPCTHNLAGYIVEFGADGDMPNVVAKNISITTTNEPTVNSFSPADNTTNIAANPNLVITFSSSVTVDTGNIVIKKASDDTTVETIAVGSGLVSGSGTSTITINPSTTFIDNTGYYIQIPNTAFKNGSNVYYAGISNTTTWNFTTGDFTPPTFSSVSANPSSTTAVITWTTNETASSQVQYGPNNSYGSTTAESDTSPRVTSHTVNLSGLVPCATYHYRVRSADGSIHTSMASSSDYTFKTSGCTNDTEPLKDSNETLDANAGGTTSLSDNNHTITVQAPANFTDDAASVAIQIRSLPSTTILNSLGNPSSTVNLMGNIVFDVKALINSTTLLDNFDIPVTISYDYSDADAENYLEGTLRLYHYHDNAWSALNDCVVTTSTNNITCTAPGFSIFGIFGEVRSSYGGGDGSAPAPLPYGCTDPKAKNYLPNSISDNSRCQYQEVLAVPSSPVSSVSNKFFFSKDFKPGANHSDIKELQKYLNANGYIVSSNGPGSPNSETTTFGKLTATALAKFQAANGIKPANGVLNSVTRAVLNGEKIITTPQVPAQDAQASIQTKVRDLTVGMTGEDVKQLQTILINHATGPKANELEKITATGLFSSYTKNALSEYQAKYKISPSSGYFGSKTRSQMKALGIPGLWW